ncbi:hypothetical protein ACFC3O_33655 [Streptomyces sp. NPDC056007]|uniref:hypothetical protein n=1 Tax=Streptomyces sp. NPDC056007 TaxID=3345678 RepID=UPI0035DDB27E
MLTGLVGLAAPWDAWNDGGLSGLALPGGGGLVIVLVVLAYVMNDSGKKGGRGSAETNERINSAIEALGRGIGRFVGGRDLVGEGRTTATWWRTGVPVETSHLSVADLAPQRPVTLAKRPGGVRGAVLMPLRALGGMGRALGQWSRWPHAARAAVRLAPLPVAWGLWRYPEATQQALIGGAVVLFLVALTGPSALGWWQVRTPGDDELLGPSLWAAVRQVLRLEDSERRVRWLQVDRDLTAEGAAIVLRLPTTWMGGKEARNVLDDVVATRIPGDWETHWERKGAAQHVRWTRKAPPAPAPVLPDYVPWQATGNPYEVFLGQMIEADEIVEAVVRTQTATPHWGVAGDTGAGKSTVLYIPVVHTRQHGGLVDILDTKQNSMKEAEGHSGVRIHKTVRACISAFAEFMVSMMAAESAMGKDADPELRNLLVERTLVVDELPTLIKVAYTWWKYGLGGKGVPPFLDWFAIILLQGRSSNHRIVIGTQQFANAYFGGTMERAQIGTKIIVGMQDRVSWGVAFGQSTPVIQYDSTIPGRGAFADKRQDPDGGGYLYVREIQPAYITPHVGELLSQCPPAPSWHGAGELAPWITPEQLAEADLTAAVGEFLPGGQFGPPSLVPVTQRSAVGVSGGSPSSEPVTGPDVIAGVTPDVTQEESEPLPEVHSLAQACAAGIVPWQHGTARRYKKLSEERKVPFPEGITDGRTTYYSEAELRDWVERYKATQRA